MNLTHIWYTEFLLVYYDFNNIVLRLANGELSDDLFLFLRQIADRTIEESIKREMSGDLEKAYLNIGNLNTGMIPKYLTSIFTELSKFL